MTIRKIIQNYLAIFLAVCFLIVNLKYDLGKGLDMEKVMDKSIDISSISFGFLLAVLALLLQGDNPGLNRIKESGNFSALVILNKKAVLASGLLIIIALLYLGLGCNKIELIQFNIEIRRLIDSICLAVLIYQLSIVFSFLDIFYYIIKQES